MNIEIPIAPKAKVQVTWIDNIKEVWAYSSMRVQYFFFAALATWFTMPAEYQQAVLSALGLTPERMVLVSAAAWFIANITSRTTKVQVTHPDGGQE